MPQQEGRSAHVIDEDLRPWAVTVLGHNPDLSYDVEVNDGHDTRWERVRRVREHSSSTGVVVLVVLVVVARRRWWWWCAHAAHTWYSSSPLLFIAGRPRGGSSSIPSTQAGPSGQLLSRSFPLLLPSLSLSLSLSLLLLIWSLLFVFVILLLQLLAPKPACHAGNEPPSSPSQLLTQSLTHSLMHSFIRSFIHSFFDSFTSLTSCTLLFTRHSTQVDIVEDLEDRALYKDRQQRLWSVRVLSQQRGASDNSKGQSTLTLAKTAALYPQRIEAVGAVGAHTRTQQEEKPNRERKQNKRGEREGGGV